MHELGLVEALVAEVDERFPGERVLRIVLEVGALAAVMPEALASCFEAVREGTSLREARLDVRRVPALARCRSCSGEVSMTSPLGVCPCGSTDLDVLEGHGLLLREVELA